MLLNFATANAPRSLRLLLPGAASAANTVSVVRTFGTVGGVN
jgi:hypothetical protein